jgi:RNA polymerase sigma factor (sigma-70 family)
MSTMANPTAERNEDVALVDRCRRGDGTAWRSLVERYQRLVYTVARRADLDEHTAADVFQTVFARLLDALPRLREPERLQAWIVTTAKREALLQRVRGARMVSMTAIDDANEDGGTWDVADESALPQEMLEELQLLERVRCGIDRLDPRCRELLLMLFPPDDDPPAYEEVARRLNMPIGGIGPTRSRCLAHLRTLVT